MWSVKGTCVACVAWEGGWSVALQGGVNYGCGRIQKCSSGDAGTWVWVPINPPLRFQAHGNTALHMAAALPPGPPQEAIVRHLLAAGADPTLRNLENEQPVHLLRPGPGPEGVSTSLTSELIGGPPTALNTDLLSEGDLGPSPLFTKSDLCQVLSSYNPNSWKTKAGRVRI